VTDTTYLLDAPAGAQPADSTEGSGPASATDAAAGSSNGSSSDATNGEGAARRRRTGSGLPGMVLPELQSLAAGLGITGTGRMRKSQLIEAIQQRQGAAHAPSAPAAAAAEPAQGLASAQPAPVQEAVVTPVPPAAEPQRLAGEQGRSADQPRQDRQRKDQRSDQGSADRPARDRQQGRPQQDRPQQGQQGQQATDRHEDDDDDGSGRGRRRRGRYRERNRRRGRDGYTPESEPEVNEDDVLVPVAGILDVLDSYAFVRTSGYLPGPNDVYVSLAQVRKNNLRKGDAVTGAVRQPQDGERRDKFNALVRLDTVNGADAGGNVQRVEFNKLTPLYPQDRLRLEADPSQLTTRIIDLVAPIGKGQRGLIVSPPKAGKTMVLQAIANAITTNNPETHLMVVLVDERPEEVTDMQRSVKGEVIASTFDRPAEDHTMVAELAIERAKRLVELGHDVIVLLDSITRLGRAYNLAAPASGRILSGGVDSTALYPPKRFFGAARNIEDGGSLTILATALVETGSRMDEVIFEEFKGTGNMELKLDRRLADRRIFPAVDVDASGTRKEEILMSRDELSIVWKLRRVMAALETQQALELLLDRLKQTKSNAEFLTQVQKTMPVLANGTRDDD